MLTNSVAANNETKTERKNFSIGIEAQRLFRPRKHGMDIVALELLKRLPVTGDGIDYHVIVKEDSDHCLDTITGRMTHVIKNAPYFIWEQFLLPQACNQFGIDVLHCTANTAPLKLKMPLILSLHDVIFLEQSNITAGASWYQRLGNIYRSVIVKKVARKAAHIITVSEFQKKLIAEKLNIPETKITVVYNGADDRFFKDLSDEHIAQVTGKLKLTQGYIFFMANTDARKNTNGVLKAYARLLELNAMPPRLVLKGINEPQLDALLKKESLGMLRSKIDLIGYVNSADLPAIYQGASMLWFPSFSEGFGLPIVEAMACGVPVITSDISCMPEIAGDAALLIDPGNPSSLAAAAQLILTDKLTASNLAAAGKKRAKLFNWDVAIKQTVRVYQQVKKDYQL